MTVRMQITATVLVLLLLGAVDFVVRVYVPRSTAERDLQMDTSLPPNETLSLAEAQQRLQSWLPDQTETAAARPGPDGGEQGAATALDASPDRAELAGRLFVLRGIFDTEGGDPFAVLEVAPVAGGSVDRHDAIAGDEIDGVRINLIDGRRVELSDGGKTIQLSLFLDPGFESVTTDEPND